MILRSMFVSMAIFVRMSVRMFVAMTFVALFVGVSIIPVAVLAMLLVRRDHVHLRRRKTAAHHLPLLKARAHIQGSGCLLKQGKRNPCIDQCAKKHVATDAGKTLKISNSHRVAILNGGGRVLLKRRDG